IKAEKERLIKEGKIKRSKKSAKSSDTPHYPYLLPNGWEWCNLEDIVCELKYGTSEKSLSVGKIAVLRMGNITNVGTIDYSNLVYSSNNEDIKLYSLEKDDLLFNRTNSSEWVGKTAIYKKEQPAIYAGYLIRIRPILIFSDYLNTVMNSSYYRNWCYNVKTDAVNQSNINAQKLSQLMIPIPPLKEQERIVVEVAKWISLINTIKNSKEDLQTTIKQAKSKILNLAIHGKLVPQDPNDEPAIELLKRINPDFTPCDNGHYTQLPEGWAICKMKQITSITNGKSQKNVETLNGIYPIYGSGGVIGRANQYLCIAGSTIIGRKGTINNPIFVEEHFWNVDTAFGLKANDAILDKYLYYFCLSFDFSKLDKSTAMPSLTKTSIGNVLIPIPPYKEQERIVAKIDMVLDTMNEILRAV
ncbi:MAG: restriction endonuclease subunit S, partial [Veillonella caviae]